MRVWTCLRTSQFDAEQVCRHDGCGWRTVVDPTEVPPLLEMMWRCDTHNCDAIPRLGRDPDRCWKGEFVKHLSVSDCSIRRRGFVPFDISDFLKAERARAGKT